VPDFIGKTLGPYRVVEQIGLGGMATVYKAYQPSMDRYVALKVLSTHLAQDATFGKRFQQEAKVIAKLEHLHILPVYDHGEEDGYLYLVMRFIEAGTLKDRLEKGPLSLDETCRIVNQVGSALEYAHQLGVVHRDIKPSNVLVTPQGDCYLTDFGIAKMVEGTLGLTGSGIVGTPHYMAPEQSQSLKVDHRADVYAMGVVIYEMVTGRVPFDAETPFAVVMKHVTELLPLPRNLRPDLPETVERVILKALAKDPADRYQSMRDLVTGFDQAVSGAPAEVRAAATPLRATQLPTLVEEAQAEPTAVVPGPATASMPAWRRWAAAQPLWLLPAAGLALIVLVLSGLIVSQIPGRVEISGGQVQVVMPTTPAPSAQLPLATATAVSAVPETPTAAMETKASPATQAAQASASPTPRPTSTPPEATAPGSTVEQARAFAEPILAAIKDRPPDFSDDFSANDLGWTASDYDHKGGDRVSVEGGQLRILVGGPRQLTHVFFPGLLVTSFALAVDVTAEGQGPADYSPGITWQGGRQTFVLNTNQHSWETRYCGSNGCDSAYASGNDPNIAAGKTLRMMVVVRGKEFALYLDGKPLAYVNDPSKAEGDDMSLAASTTATEQSILVAYDNFELWNLDKMPGLAPAQATPATSPMILAMQHADQAKAYIAQSRWDEALAEIGQAIELDPTDPQYYMTRASIYDEGKGMMDQAVADATKAVELAPASYDAWATRGGVYLHMDKCGLGAADFERAIQLDPRRPEGYVDRADALSCAGKLDEAIADYNRGLELAPDSPWAYWTRGMTYEKKGDLAAALADYNRAIQLNPGDTRDGPNWHLSRAGVYRVRGQHDQALADCAAILALAPNDPRGFYCRGMSEAALGQTDQARADFKQAISLTPTSAWSAWVTEAARTELNKIGP
jgi:tetratricopeptide (TPR) repeat protein/predicted Ser/Thr protein kinase